MRWNEAWIWPAEQAGRPLKQTVNLTAALRLQFPVSSQCAPVHWPNPLTDKYQLWAETPRIVKDKATYKAQRFAAVNDPFIAMQLTYYSGNGGRDQGCCERLKICPSGSLNQATFAAPPGASQTPNSSC